MADENGLDEIDNLLGEIKKPIPPTETQPPPTESQLEELDALIESPASQPTPVQLSTPIQPGNFNDIDNVLEKPLNDTPEEAVDDFIKKAIDKRNDQVGVVERFLNVAQEENDVEGVEQAKEALSQVKRQVRSKIEIASHDVEQGALEPSPSVKRTVAKHEPLEEEFTLLKPITNKLLKGLEIAGKTLDTIDVGPLRRKLFGKMLGVSLTDEEAKFGGKTFGDIFLDKLTRDNPQILNAEIDLPVGPFDTKLKFGPILGGLLATGADVADILFSPTTLLTFGQGKGLKAGGRLIAKEVVKADAEAVIKQELKVAMSNGDSGLVKQLQGKLDNVLQTKKEVSDLESQISKTKSLEPEALDQLQVDLARKKSDLQENILVFHRAFQEPLSTKGTRMKVKLRNEGLSNSKADEVVLNAAKTDPSLLDRGGIKFGYWGIGKMRDVLPEFQLATGKQIKQAARILDRSVDAAVNKATGGRFGKPFPGFKALNTIDEVLEEADLYGKVPDLDELSQKVNNRFTPEEKAAFVDDIKSNIQIKGPNENTAQQLQLPTSQHYSIAGLNQAAPGREYLHTKMLEKLRPKAPEQSDIFLDISGSAGAGKSEITSYYLGGEALDDVAYRGDPDRFKEFIPEYDKNLPQFVHEESSAASKAHLGEAIDNGYYAVREGTMSDLDAEKKFLAYLRDKNKTTVKFFLDQTEPQLVEAYNFRKSRGDRLPPLEDAKAKRLQGLENIKQLWGQYDDFVLFSKSDDGLTQVPIFAKIGNEGKYVKGNEQKITEILGSDEWRTGLRRTTAESNISQFIERSEPIRLTERVPQLRAGREGFEAATGKAQKLTSAKEAIQPGILGDTFGTIRRDLRKVFRRDLSIDPNYLAIKQATYYNPIQNDRQVLIDYLANSVNKNKLNKNDARLLSYAMENSKIDGLPDELQKIAKTLTDSDRISIKDLPDNLKVASKDIEALTQHWAGIEQELEILDDVLESYVPHIYKERPKEVIEKLTAWRNRSDVTQTSSFRKHRKIPTLSEARKLGFTPVDDIYEIMTMRGTAHSNVVRTRQFLSVLDKVLSDTRGVNVSNVAGKEVARMSSLDNFSPASKEALKDLDDVHTITRVIPDYDTSLGVPKKADLEAIKIKRNGVKELTLHPFKELPAKEQLDNPQWIIEKKIDELKGRVGIKDIQDDLDQLTGVFKNDPHYSLLAKNYDKVLNLYKGYLTSIFPAFHVRNAISNTIQNLLNVGLDALNPRRNIESMNVLNQYLGSELATRGGTYAKLGNLIKESSGGALRTITGDVHTYEGLANIAKNLNVIQGDFVRSDLTEEAVGQLASKLQGTAGKLNPFSKDFVLINIGRQAGSIIENQGRLLSFISHVRQGRTLDEAAFLTKKFLFDYSNLSKIEKNVFKRMFFFYTWPRKNLELQMGLMLKHPGAYLGLFRIADRIKDRAQLPEKEEDAVLGRIAKMGFVLPVDREGEELLTISGLGLPQETLTQFLSDFRKGIGPGFSGLTRQTILQSLPAQLVTQMATGVDVFTQMQSGRITRVPNSFKYLPKPVQDSIELQPRLTKDGNVIYTARPDVVQILKSLPTSRLLSTLINVEKFNDEDKLFMASVLTGVRIQKINIAKELFKSLRQDLERDSRILGSEKKQIIREFRFQGDEALPSDPTSAPPQ